MLETAGRNGLDCAGSSGQEIAGKHVLQCSAGNELEKWVEWASVLRGMAQSVLEECSREFCVESA